MNASPADDPRLRVLVVDDSAVVRQLMSACLEGVGMEVQSAADPIFAMQKLQRWSPDVIVLDLEMPRMDGLTFLRLLRSEGAIPVVICSGIAGSRTVTAMRALEEGAVEIVARPRVAVREFFQDSLTLLTDAIRGAAQARPRRGLRRIAAASSAGETAADGGLAGHRIRRAASAAGHRADARLVAVGASTGGTEALHHLIAAMPPDAPAMVVVQHMPEGFTAAFAARLGDGARVRVKEAQSGDPIRRGSVLIAPGGRHLTVRNSAQGPVAEVTDGPLVSRHRPSVDVLFRSVAAIAGRRGVGVLLTGMGDDGRDGMLALRAAGAHTLAQDEASCVVFGMPKAAIEAGAVDEVVPLARMTDAILGGLAPGRPRR